MRFNDRYEDQGDIRFNDFVTGVIDTILANFKPTDKEDLACIRHDFQTHEIRYQPIPVEYLKDYLRDYFHKIKSGSSMEVTGSAWRSVSFVVRVGDRDVEKLHIARPTQNPIYPQSHKGDL